ncbi:restriction endonuclease subunit M, partial [Campylobacter fetus subsp. venerealis]
MNHKNQLNQETNWMSNKEKKPNIYFMKAKYEIDDEFYTSYHEIKKEL